MAIEYLAIVGIGGQCWTLQTIKSAINKIFRFKINVGNKDIDLPRRKKDVVNRVQGHMIKRLTGITHGFDYISDATGLRRNMKLKKKNIKELTVYTTWYSQRLQGR